MNTRKRQTNFNSINPANGQLLQRYPEYRWKQVQQTLYKVRGAQWQNAALPIAARSVCMHRLADLLIERKHTLAHLITAEMGKPIRQSFAEIDKCALVCRYYANHAHELLNTPSPYPHATIRQVPMGVILAIMPWNFPFWQVFRCAAAALMAGNAVVLKHAPNVPQCALAIQDLVCDSGFPADVLSNLFVSESKIKWLIESPQIDMLAFTGSNATAAKVGEIAGRCTKKMVMELGGSDPFLILDDAPIREAAQAALRSRLVNSGQSCIAAKRLLVMDAVAHEFIGEILHQIKQLRIDNPALEHTDLGPLARPDLYQHLTEQVETSVRMGARVIYGGTANQLNNSLFFPPTVLLHLDRDMPVMQEETFGPVLPICVVKNTDDLLRLANDTPYGLGATIWTADPHRAAELAQRLRVGTVCVNGVLASDPQLPFGGTKRSGFGRELGKEGILEYTYSQVLLNMKQ